MRAGRLKHIRELVAFAEGIGVAAVEVEQRGRHPALTGVLPDGRTMRYPLPCTPGDRVRGAKNAQAELRRLVRACTRRGRVTPAPSPA
jgi:hypothetical protein